MRRPVHIVIREALRRFRRDLARPVEVALRQELEDRDAAHERLATRVSGLEASGNALRAEIADVRSALSRLDRVPARIAALETATSNLEAATTSLQAACVAVAELLLPRQPSEPRDTRAAPRVSIILPTRDRAGMVGDAIRSVLAQTLHDWELVIVDDGSTDGTIDVLRPFLSDSRIALLRSPPVGCSAARNLGLRHARGELIAYIDSDNLWFPGFLAGMVAAFEQDPGLDTGYGVLVGDSPYFGGSRILWRAFDRAALLQGNFIDLGTFVHRRRLSTELGGFDEELSRVVDWDLVLRYTVHKPARALPVLASYYRTRAPGRVTDQADYGSNWYRIRRKWHPRVPRADRLRVLCVVGEEEPTLPTSCVWTELRALERLGADLDVWSAGSDAGAETAIPAAVRSGALGDVVNEVRPDLVHALGMGGVQAATAAGLPTRVPVTLRTLGHEDLAGLRSLLEQTHLRRVFALPQQVAAVGGRDSVRSVRAVFDTQRFRPARKKERRLVVQNAAGLGEGELRFFLSLAAAAPGYPFVLFATRAPPQARAAIARVAAETASPARIALDLSDDEASGLVSRAGIYVRSLGQPEGEVSDGATSSFVLEAMATGAYVLAPDLPWSRELVDGAGALCSGLDDATARLEATEGWGDGDWSLAQRRSIDRAFVRHADETTLWSILQQWGEIVSAERS